MNSVSFEYYVNRTRSLETAIRWLKVYVDLHDKYSFKQGGNMEKFIKIKLKGAKAAERLFELL